MISGNNVPSSWILSLMFSRRRRSTSREKKKIRTIWGKKAILFTCIVGFSSPAALIHHELHTRKGSSGVYVF